MEGVDLIRIAMFWIVPVNKMLDKPLQLHIHWHTAHTNSTHPIFPLNTHFQLCLAKRPSLHASIIKDSLSSLLLFPYQIPSTSCMHDNKLSGRLGPFMTQRGINFLHIFFTRGKNIPAIVRGMHGIWQGIITGICICLTLNLGFLCACMYCLLHDCLHEWMPAWCVWPASP